ncbi:hypothetical protein D3C80_1069350 [compost metagenome]
MQTQLDIADGTKTVAADSVGGVSHLGTVCVQIGQRQVGGGQIADQLAIICIPRRVEDRPPQHHRIADIAHRRQAHTTTHGFIQRIDRKVQAAHFHYAEQQREHQQTNDDELHDVEAERAALGRIATDHQRCKITRACRTETCSGNRRYRFVPQAAKAECLGEVPEKSRQAIARY